MKQTCIMTFIILPIRLETFGNENKPFTYPLTANSSCSCLCWHSSLRSLSAFVKQVALSDSSDLGVPLSHAIAWRACRNVSADKSGTVSIWMALLTMHVKSAIHTFLLALPSLMKCGPL